MKKLHYDRLQNTLQSLKDSTDCTILLEDEGVALTRRNAAYSRQEVSMLKGHGQADHVLLKNDKHACVLVKKNKCANPSIEGFASIEVPCRHFEGFFPFPLSRPEWLRGTCVVHIPDFFQGYDSEFRPIWAEFRELVFPSRREVFLNPRLEDGDED